MRHHFFLLVLIFSGASAVVLAPFYEV